MGANIGTATAGSRALPHPSAPAGAGAVPAAGLAGGSAADIDSSAHRGAGVLACTFAALERRNAELHAELEHCVATLTPVLHALALGHAVLRRLDLPPEARAIVLQQSRGYEAAMAAVATLRPGSPAVPGDDSTAAAPAGDASHERAAVLPPGSRVLVIDDDPAVRLASRLLLEMLDLDVRVAAGRADALASVAAERPDVVVVDCALAAGDTGEAVLRALEERCGHALPGVLVSGQPRAPAVADGRTVLRKPFRGDALLAALGDAWRAAALSPADPAPARVPAPSAHRAS